MQSGANGTALFKLHVYLLKKYSMIRIANYKSAEIVDIDGTFYMFITLCK